MIPAHEMTVYFGGWYQRTTLHLTEVADFLSFGVSHLPLNKEKLQRMWSELEIKSVSRESGYLEYVRMETKNDVVLSYYEDGLYVLKTRGESVERAKEKLERYYESKLAPAIAYIFSLGAPTPKELANIKSVHPVAVAITKRDPEKYLMETKYGDVYSSITTEELVVHKTPGFIFLVAKPSYAENLESLIEMQIFFREFKDQLQKYLNIHRKLWEEISEIKERKQIRGSEVEKVRIELDTYEKTINLIGSRINQMASYVHTRAGIAHELKLTDHLSKVFSYKFEVLTNTHGYIKEIWTMTQKYLETAIQVITEIKAQATNKSIQSLQLITTYGVVGGIIGYLSRDSFPRITEQGMMYFGVLILTTFAVNLLVKLGYAGIKYKIRFGDKVKNL